MTFNEAAVNGVFDSIVSHALRTGRFDRVNQHEPKNAPGNGVQCSVWIQFIRPLQSSGMTSTSGVVVLHARTYTNMKQHPLDMIDPNVTASACDLIGVLSEDYTLGGMAGVRGVDLIGMSGESLNGQAGYLEIDRQYFRIMTINIPIIINDMWIHGATSG